MKEKKEINLVAFFTFGFFTNNEINYRFLVFQQYSMNLKERMGISGLNFRQASLLFNQLLNGLEYLHFNGISHSDILPQNILMDFNFNKICLSDLGNSYRFLINNVHTKQNSIELLNIDFKGRNWNFISRDAYYSPGMFNN